MNIARAFVAFIVNAVILLLAFQLIPGVELGVGNIFVVPLLSMVMTLLTWFVWNYSLTRNVAKQKREHVDAELADLRARLARLESVSAAEHLSDDLEGWEQIDIKRKGGMN